MNIADAGPSLSPSPSPAPAPAPGAARRRLLRVFRLEAKYEILKLLRMPGFVVPTLAFPSVFYLFFGIALAGKAQGGASMFARYLIATYGASAMLSCALLGLGAGVAVERGQGWLQVKRATPMPLAAYFTAKLAGAIVFGSATVALLGVLGATLGGVRFPPLVWVELLASLAIGSLPFCALGLAIGYLAGPNSAPAVVNLLFFPLAIASGLWMPIQFLPSFFQRLAPLLPPYHLGQLALGIIGTPDTGSAMLHAGALGVALALFLGLAWFAYRRDEGKTYG